MQLIRRGRTLLKFSPELSEHMTKIHESESFSSLNIELVYRRLLIKTVVVLGVVFAQIEGYNLCV